MNELLDGFKSMAVLIIFGLLLSGKQNLPDIQGEYEMKTKTESSILKINKQSKYRYNIAIENRYYKIEKNTTQKLIKQENLIYTGNVLQVNTKLKENLNFFDQRIFRNVTYYKIHFDNNSENIELKGSKNMIKKWNKSPLIYYSKDTTPSPKIKIGKVYYNQIKN